MGMTFTGGFTLTGGSRTFGVNNGSVSFNGSSQYLTVPSNTAFDFGTGDFTIEFWAYFNVLGATDRMLVDRWSSGNAGSYQIYYRGSTSSIAFLVGSGTIVLTDPSTSNITTNTWNHIAVTRSGTTARLFVNGLLVNSATNSTSLTSALTLAVGVQLSTSTIYFNGYISNLRITKGVAVYASTFALPVGNLLPVQNANENGYPSRTITGAQTSLLLNTFLNSPNFLADSSPYTFTVTNVGGATSSSLVPTYSSLTNGSVSFNGTTHYLAVPSNAAFSFGTNDFTIEHWVYSTSFAVLCSTISLFSNNSGSYITGQCEIRINTSGTISFVYATGTSTIVTLTTSSAISLNNWYHIAVVRSGSGTGNLNIYINGVVLATSGGAVTQAIGTTGTGRIGLNANTSGNLIFTGYLSNMRIVNGVAVYTSNFTPPTNVLTVTQSANTNGSPSSAITSTQTSLLLATYYGNGFIGDGSTNAILVTNPASAPSSTVAPTLTGTPINGSLFVNASYINTTTTSSAFTLGTNDFTIEFWIYMTSVTGTKRIFGNVTTSSDTGFSMDTNGTQIGMGGWTTFTYFTPSPSLSGAFLNQWVHVAWVRINGVESLYVNGVSIGSVTRSLNFSGTGAVYLGVAGSFNTNFPMTGYLSNFRIVKGVGVYSGNFNVPSSPLGVAQSNNQNGFPSLAISDTQTSIILNTYYGNPKDSSPNQFLFTTSSSVTSSTQAPTFSPYTLTNGSVSFNGTSQYLTAPSSSTAWTFGTGEFTVEFWMYPTVLSASSGVIVSNWVAASGSYVTGQWEITCDNNSSGQISFNWATGASTTSSINSGTTVPALNTWQHVAVVRNSTTITIYLNGVSVGSGTMSTSLGATGTLAIGYQQVNSPQYYTGYLSNIRIVKGVAVYTSNFNLPSTPFNSSQYINRNGYPSAAVTSSQTSLLLNTYTGNSFASDSSTNGFVITNTGTATSSSQAPTFISSLTNGSVSLNGTSQYLIAPIGTSTFGTGDFTVEAWFYKTAATSNGSLNNATGSNNSYWLLGTYTDGHYEFYVRDSVAIGTSVVGSITTSLNTWVHVAVTRQSNLVRLFVNGVLDNSGTITKTITARTTNIGSFQYPGFLEYFTGYISNVRIVTGLAVYTTSFIVPSSPLGATQDAGVNGFPSAAITGSQTTLLLNTYYGAYNLLDDGSINNYTITNTGAAPTSTLAPTFTSTTFTNGSVSFNGTSQYLSIPANTVFSYSTSDFTWECWVYPTAYGAAAGSTIDFWSNASGAYITGQCQLQINTSGTVQFYYATGASAFTSIVTSTTLSINNWYHLAVVRSGSSTGNLKIYINGVVSATSAGAVTQALGSTGVGSIGRQTNVSGTSYFYTGYISNVRIVKGVALYTNTFIVPTDPLTVSQNINNNGYPSAAVTSTQTSLLLNTYYGSYFIADSSNNNFVLTNNGTATSSTSTPSFLFNYTNSSVSFNGTSQYLTLSANSAYSFGTSDFTIESWVYLTSAPGNVTIIDTRTGDTLSAYFFGIISSLKLHFVYSGAAALDSTSTVSLNTWQHVVVTRISGVIKFFINGQLDATTVTYSSAINAASFPSIGAGRSTVANSVTGYYLPGYISNFRIVNGVAVYASTFAVPTGPLSVTQTINQNGFPSNQINSSTQTSLLLNTYYGTGFTSDGSTNNFTVTNNGTATNSTLNPFG